jgi:PhnB protein
MATQLTPYLSFNGNARQAMEFYHGVVGGTLEMNTFAEFGIADGGDKIMHATLTADDGFIIMGSDVPPGMEYHEGQRVTVMLHGEDEAALRGAWDALAEGGSVQAPLEQQVWGDVYGALTDRFGIVWMVNIAAL